MVGGVVSLNRVHTSTVIRLYRMQDGQGFTSKTRVTWQQVRFAQSETSQEVSRLPDLPRDSYSRFKIYSLRSANRRLHGRLPGD